MDILTSKFISLMITTVLVIFGVFVFSLLVGLSFGGLGSFKYPILIYEVEESFSFMHLGKFLWKSTVLFIFVVLFVYSLLIILSHLLKGTILTIGSTIIILIIGHYLTSEEYLSAIAPYLPFTYLNVPAIIANEKAVLLNNFQIQQLTGTLTLLISTLIIWYIFRFLSKRKTI